MSQDFIEDLMWKVVKAFLAKLGKFFFRKSKKPMKYDQTTSSETETSDTVVKENENNQNIENSLINDKEDSQSDEDKIREDANVEDESSSDDEDVGLLMKADHDAKTGTKQEVEESSETSTNETNIPSNGSNQNTSQSWSELLKNDEIFFHFTIFLLWSVITFINVPVVLAWAHNYK